MLLLKNRKKTSKRQIFRYKYDKNNILQYKSCISPYFVRLHHHIVGVCYAYVQAK